MVRSRRFERLRSAVLSQLHRSLFAIHCIVRDMLISEHPLHPWQLLLRPFLKLGLKYELNQAWFLRQYVAGGLKAHLAYHFDGEREYSDGSPLSHTRVLYTTWWAVIFRLSAPRSI